jgi:hypothetical protein
VSTRRHPWIPWPVVAGVAAVSLVGCAEPELPPNLEPEPQATEDPIEDTSDEDELRDHLVDLETALGQVRDALSSAREASSLAGAHASVEQALAVLLVDPETAEGAAVGDHGAPPPLLPSETVERTGSAAPDLLSSTLTIAQDAGGTLGRRTVDVLSDEIAGDMGAWQRDPHGMVELARQVATSSTDLGTLEAAVLELSGEGTRALAWSLVAQEADDLDLAQDAAERALAHVELILLAVEDIGGST